MELFVIGAKAEGTCSDFALNSPSEEHTREIFQTDQITQVTETGVWKDSKRGGKDENRQFRFSNDTQ